MNLFPFWHGLGLVGCRLFANRSLIFTEEFDERYLRRRFFRCWVVFFTFTRCADVLVFRRDGTSTTDEAQNGRRIHLRPLDIQDLDAFRGLYA